MPDLSLPDLIQQCLSGNNQQAWEDFYLKFRRLIASTIIKTAGRFKDLSRETADDLVQETYLRICADNFRALRTFHSTEPLAIYGLVKTIAYSVVQDHFRGLQTLKRGRDAERLSVGPEGVDPPDSKSAEKIESEVLIHEIDQLLKDALTDPLRERDRTVFWLYYRHGLTAKAIAALPGIDLSAKGVESLILRLTGEVRRRIATEKATPKKSAKGFSTQFSF